MLKLWVACDSGTIFSNFERVNDSVGLICRLLLRLVNRWSQLHSLKRRHWILTKHLLKPLAQSKHLLLLVHIDALEQHAVPARHLDHTISIFILLEDGGLSIGCWSERLFLFVAAAAVRSWDMQAPSLSTDIALLVFDKQRPIGISIHWNSSWK